MINSPTWSRVQGNWKQLSGHVHQQWEKLTEDDITQISGNHDILSGKIQNRYGISQAEANQQIDIWADVICYGFCPLY